MVREPEENGMLAYCQKNDILLRAYSPLETGALTGKNGLLEEIARKYGKTSVQITLNWLISQQNVVTIAKTSNVEHLKENLGAVGWELEKEDVELLRRDFSHDG